MNQKHLPRHPITVDEYYRMAETGQLAPDARVELIEGEIVNMTPIGCAHRAIVVQWDELLHRALGTRGLVQAQQPVRLDAYSEPEPDIAVVHRRADFYKSSHPSAADILFLIEVSDSSLQFDLQTKVPLYARHAVPEVWVCDLTSSQMHVFRSPAAGRYTEAYSVSKLDTIRPAAFQDVTIDLSELVWP